MKFRSVSLSLSRFVFALLLASSAPLLRATPTLWTGPVINFNQPSADPTQAANQDRITSGVWLTRANRLPLFNAKTESSFSQATSPADTEWAYGLLANFASLRFTNWEQWVGGGPFSQSVGSPVDMVGSNVVLHLKAEDIYLQIKFLQWNSGGVGGYSYNRTTAPPPTPAVAVTNPAGGAVFAAPANVKLGVSATVSSGTVTNVNFFTNGIKSGTVKVAPFNFTATNLHAGSYALTAVATAAGISATSLPVSINVVTPLINALAPPSGAAGQFTFSYSATPGLRYVVQSSSNLLNWKSLSTNTPASSPVPFSDALQSTNSMYYRVGRLPNP